MQARKTMLCVMFTLIFFLCGCQTERKESAVAPAATGPFSFAVLKAGQADAIIMQTAQNCIVLDLGEQDDGDEIVSYLKERNITNMDYLFITHFDKDHVGGFPEVMESMTASQILVPDYTGNNEEYEAYLKTVEAKNLSVTTLSENATFTVDDVLIDVDVPQKQYYEEGDNDYSLVLSVTHGENTFLFPGDAEKGRLPEVMQTFGKTYAFLKVPHHGKHNKYTKQFVSTVKPKYAVITDSDKHPAEKETTSILESFGTEIYSTRNGDVLVTSDGKNVTIQQ